MTRLYGTVAVCGSGAASGRAHSGAGHGTHPAHPPLHLWGQSRLTNGGRICVGSLQLGPGRASPRLCRPVPPSGPGGALARGRAGLLFSPRQPRVPAPDRAGGIPAAFPSPINLSPSQANSPCSELGSGARSASRSSAGASRRERGKERSAAARRAAAGRAREPRSPAEPRPDGRPRPPPPVQGPESGRSAGPELRRGGRGRYPSGRSRAPLRRVHRGSRRLYRRGDGAAAVALPRRRVSMRYSSPIYCLSPATQCVPHSLGPSPQPPAPGPLRVGPTAPQLPPATRRCPAVRSVRITAAPPAPGKFKKLVGPTPCECASPNTGVCPGIFHRRGAGREGG